MLLTGIRKSPEIYIVEYRDKILYSEPVKAKDHGEAANIIHKAHPNATYIAVVNSMDADDTELLKAGMAIL